MNECPRCGRLPGNSHTEACALQGEIERLRAELATKSKRVADLGLAVVSLRAELAEWKATTPALKPDCRTCGYFEWRVYECWFESSNPNRLCVDGSEHLHADPVRLYEAGGE